MINKEKLDFWIRHKKNVLLVGKHGVGKTTIVLDAFQEHGLRYKYYSCSTMDPWVDFIGIPKEAEKDGIKFLDLVRPKEFADDEVDVIFLDEFNRSKEGVRNAVLELIQFKSINGKKFKNLKMVWAAINPEDEEHTYDVERLDPAQKSRFHIKYNVPYLINMEYFTQKFGAHNARVANDWWTNLSPEVKDEVCPRTLDYALEISRLNGDIADALPASCNPSHLQKLLIHGLAKDILLAAIQEKDRDTIRKLANTENTYTDVIKDVLKDKTLAFDFIPEISEEKLTSLISENNQNDEMLKTILCGFHGISPTRRNMNKLSEEEKAKYIQRDEFRQKLSDICDREAENNIKNVAYDIYGNIPILPSEVIGTEPIIDMEIFDKNREFADFENSIIKKYEDEDFEKTTDIKVGIIDFLYKNITNNLDTQTYLQCLRLIFLVGIRMLSTDTTSEEGQKGLKAFDENAEKFFKVLNYCLKKADRDIIMGDSTDGKGPYLVITNCLIAQGYDKYLWIKNS